MTKHLPIRILILNLYILAFFGCASSIPLPENSGFQNGLPYSTQTFANGSFRFAEGGWPFGDGDTSEAIREGRYEDALTLLVEDNKASDKSYNDLGLVAEKLGHYEAASIYYDLASALFVHEKLSKCRGEREFIDPDNPTTYQIYAVSTCFKLTRTQINESKRRASMKAEGTWRDTIIEYHNGTVFVGAVDSAGRPAGIGEMTSPDGSFYFGEFANGKKSGAGTMRIHLDSNDLIFVGTFVAGKPSYGALYNPSMSLMGVKFGKAMRYRNGGFYYYDGDPLGSNPGDNNYWFSGGWGETIGSAITQGTVMYSMGQSPLFASDDPLIDRVCDSNPLIAGAAKNDRRCD